MYYNSPNYQYPYYNYSYQQPTPSPKPHTEPPQKPKGSKAAKVLLILGAILVFLGIAGVIAFIIMSDAWSDDYYSYKTFFWICVGIMCLGGLLIVISLFIKKNVLAGIAFLLILIVFPVSLVAYGEKEINYEWHLFHKNDTDNSSGSSTSSDSSGSSTSYITSKFSSAYSYANCLYPWAEHGSDWSYISIDTNPYDYDNSDYPYSSTQYLSVATDAIKKLNRYFDLPESLYNEMTKTTALMGRQSKVYSSKKIEVSWTYHPDNGLEVMYSVIES